MDFIRELRKTAYDIATQNGIITDTVSTSIPVSTAHLSNCMELIVEELFDAYTSDYKSIEASMHNWFMRMAEGGMVVAIAAQFDNNNTTQLRMRSQTHKVAFSFHLNFYLERKKDAFEKVYLAVNEFVLANEAEIKGGNVDKLEVLNAVLMAGALLGIELCNRIEIRKEDFLAIHHELIIEDDELDDLDYEDEEYTEDEDDEVVDEDDDSYSVYCPFCAQPNLFQQKDDKGLKQTEISFCDHLALGFITNAEKKIVGIDYYTYYLEQSLNKVVAEPESEKPSEFAERLNTFYVEYNPKQEADVLSQLSLFLPEHKSRVKQFVATIGDTEHRFVFHYLKLLKQSIE